MALSEAWKGYRHAPEPGTPVCPLSEVPEAGTLCLNLGGFPLLLVNAGGALRAWVNACPHQYLPLDHKGSRLLSADGRVLRCTSHGAGFLAETGEGVEGPGAGLALDPVPVATGADGMVRIG
ncbi:MAG: Rieske (2Fe-2S) protein [Pikeienuella sp.]|uniref:Rieske (2Fe-2S) protein n=1 Tax=Pikeienuella sp. TaxID=2831957 RepID=UPI00391D9D60